MLIRASGHEQKHHGITEDPRLFYIERGLGVWVVLFFAGWLAGHNPSGCPLVCARANPDGHPSTEWDRTPTRKEKKHAYHKITQYPFDRACQRKENDISLPKPTSRVLSLFRISFRFLLLDVWTCFV